MGEVALKLDISKAFMTELNGIIFEKSWKKWDFPHNGLNGLCYVSKSLTTLFLLMVVLRDPSFWVED